MRLSCGLGWAAACVLLVGCGGTVEESGTVEGSGGTSGQGGSGGWGGQTPKGGSGGGVAGAGGTATEAGTYCYSNEACAPNEWCDLEPAAPGMCSSGGKAGSCKPRPTMMDCPEYDQCPNVCGCNGKWYCGACEAHVEGISITADNTWCMDGGTVMSCGGWGGAVCPPDMFCDYPANDPCGGADSPGVCVPRPMCPDPGGSGACGCDGQYYLSECSAQASGTDVTGGKECVDAGTGQYSAEAWYGGLDHVLIHKADWDRNVCLTIHLASPHQPIAGLSTPDGWGLASASISNNAGDCAGGTSTGDPVVSTQTVTGAISFGYGDGGYMPCTVNVHATLVFTSGPSWVYPNELMNADGVLVAGGCL